MVNLLAEFGYILFPIVSGLGIAYTFIWLKDDEMTPATRGFVIAFGLMMFAVMLRVGWFSLSRYITIPIDNSPFCIPKVQNEWMWRNKEWTGALAGFIWLMGGLTMYYHIEQKSKTEVAVVGFVVIMTAIVIAIT